MKSKFFPLFHASAILAAALPASAQTTWDGGGLADTSWGTAANWDNDSPPAFDGTDSLTVTAPSTGNTALTLGADRSIGRITFGSGGTGTAMSLSGNTLQLSRTTTSAAAGLALWNANTKDNITATVNSNILLQSGAAGSYTGYLREDQNSSGGTRFNGTITQGAGESWTLRFSRSNARGIFNLNNASNSISAIRNDGADVFSEVVGAFGGAALTLAGGFTGTTTTDHYTTAVSNSITLAANSQWVSQIQTRLTGAASQGSYTLTYGSANNNALGNGALTRLEYGSFSGTGTTTLVGGALSASSMSNLSSGALDLGSSTSSAGTLVLSGASGNGVPTWSDFTGAKTYNQSGGAGNWRINAGTAGTNTGNFGGFAARGADLVIPASGGGLTSSTFARNFVLGSAATLNSAQYAANSVTIQTDIAYGSVAGANRYFQIAPNQGTSKTSNTLTLAGPVHELSGQITGDSVIMYPLGQISNSSFGLVRISNATNSLTGTSRWMIGGNRSAFTSAGGGSIAAANNMGDLGSSVLVFTSDGAFGGATEVQVTSQVSSGTQTSGTVLFEDANGAGNTTFTRNLNLVNNNQNQGPPAWGSYGGDVVYTGTATMSGTLATANDSILHVQSGTMNLGVNGSSAATITNNMLATTTFDKSGAGTLRIENLTVNGTQATNNWNVRQGTLLVNTTLAGAVTVSTGATLGGTGTLGGTVTTGTGGNAVIAPGTSVGLLTLSGAFNTANGGVFKMELGSNATPGTTHDQIAAGGIFTGSTAASGLKFEFTAQPGLAAGVTYTLLTFASSSGLGYADLAATALPSGFALDTSFGTNGWLINAGSLQVQFVSVGDVTPPTWAASWPFASGITSSGFTLHAKSDENGTACFVVLPNNATAPSSAEVVAGTAAGGGSALANGTIALTANTENTGNVTGMSASTDYDVYLVAQDAVPNLQPSPVKLDVTTATPLSAYDSWASGFSGFSPTDATLDFDNDGLNNLLEFVLGGDPRVNDTPSICPAVSAPGSDLVLTFKRSDASELQPVTVKVQVSDDLATWNPANDITIGPGPTGTGPNSASYTVDESGDLDTIIVTIPKAAASKKFARVVATE